jgi:hypothetical protein
MLGIPRPIAHRQAYKYRERLEKRVQKLYRGH